MNKMPVLFVGHGSPMNAIENNAFTKGWTSIGKSLPRPKAILAISAHWYTKGTRVLDDEKPKTIYDMYGFPKELYEVNYPAPGSKELSNHIVDLLKDDANLDTTWGLDHGTWSVLHAMYPSADIPVVQLSVDQLACPEVHFELGRKLKPLREEGVLILASGNVVHSFAYLNWQMSGGHPWAVEFDKSVKNAILSGNFEGVVNHEKISPHGKLAFQTPDHYLPLLYALGASEPTEDITVFNEACVMGSMSMTSYVLG